MSCTVEPRCLSCNSPMRRQGNNFWFCVTTTCRMYNSTLYLRKSATIPHQANAVESALLAELQKQTRILEEILENTRKDQPAIRGHL